MNVSKIIGLILMLIFFSAVYPQAAEKELFVVAHNYKWGFMTREGKIAIPL